MDAPVTRSKQQTVDFYVGNLDEFFGLNDEQYHAVRTAMVLLYGEVEDKLHALYIKQLDGATTLNNQIAALRQANSDAEEEIGRLCTELQELKAKRVATIQMNGTAPSHEPEDPPAMPQQLEPATPAAASPPRRGGRKPGTKNKPKETPRLTPDEIAKQIEGGTPGQMVTIDRSLISDDPNVVALNGTLRREESFASTQHGIPVRVTRQYIEIR